jgi:peroxiredoxin
MLRQKLQALMMSALLLATLVFAPWAGAQGKRVTFEMRSLDDVTVTSQGLRGQVVVLAFGASWLPLSRKQMTGLREFAAKNAAKGIAVHWVSVDSENPKSRNYASDETLRAFARKYGINVPVLRDPDGAVSAKFGVDQLPTLVVLDKKGELVGEPIGGLDPDGNIADQLQDQIAEATKRK